MGFGMGCLPGLWAGPSLFRHVAAAIAASSLLLASPCARGAEESAPPGVPAPDSARRELARARLLMLGLGPGPGPLWRVVATGHAPLVHLCLAAQWDVNAPGDNQITPLMAAAARGRTELVRTLLACGAQPASRDAQNRLALHYAVAAGDAASVDLLLPLSPDLAAPFGQGNNLLGQALSGGNERIIRAVLERIPPTLAWSTATRAALDDALRRADHARIRLLLGKHPAPPTPEGRSSPLLACAIATGNEALFHLLLANGADPETVLPSPCEPEFLRLLPPGFLRHYAEEDRGITLLMLAAGLGKTAFVKALLEAGASRLRPTARHRMLPVYFSSRTDDWRSTQLLLGAGPAPEILRVEISLASQQVVVFKNDSPVFVSGCSTGRTGFETKPGDYVVTDKIRSHRSNLYDAAMPFFMRLSCRDFGMHQGEVPDYPASHGCIRLPGEAARRLFGEIPIGTLVRIY